jgi:hypothetical protein
MKMILCMLCFVMMMITVALSSSAASSGKAPEFALSIPRERSAQPLDGRMLLLLSTDPSAEPRMQVRSEDGGLPC